MQKLTETQKKKLTSLPWSLEESLDSFEEEFFYPGKIEDQLVAEYFYCKDNNLNYDCDRCTTNITQKEIDAILNEKMAQLNIPQNSCPDNLLGFFTVSNGSQLSTSGSHDTSDEHQGIEVNNNEAELVKELIQ